MKFLIYLLRLDQHDIYRISFSKLAITKEMKKSKNKKQTNKQTKKTDMP